MVFCAHTSSSVMLDTQTVSEHAPACPSNDIPKVHSLILPHTLKYKSTCMLINAGNTETPIRDISGTNHIVLPSFFNNCYNYRSHRDSTSVCSSTEHLGQKDKEVQLFFLFS